jgi:hypothetical protein
MKDPLNQIIYVVVKIEVTATADQEDVLSNMDYDFRHPDIVDTEISELLTDI